MLGSLPKKKHQVPITASGNGAAAFKETMAPYHMDITLAGEKPVPLPPSNWCAAFS